MTSYRAGLTLPRVTDRSDPDARTESLSLSSEGVSQPKLGRVPWSDVMGAVCLDKGRNQRTYVLMRREPPQPPWFAVTPAMLKSSGLSCDLRELATTLNERVGQGGYRHTQQRATRMEADELFKMVMQREAIAESLEIGRGPGPRRRLSRLADAIAGAAAGGMAGFMLTVFLHQLAWLPWAAGGLALLGGGFTQLSRTPRVKGGPARVLVMTPDGCVVGFPEGPRAFAWSDLGPFTIGASDPARRPRSKDGLDVVDAQGKALGHIDRAWFRGRLEVIVALANAYRMRIG